MLFIFFSLLDPRLMRVLRSMHIVSILFISRRVRWPVGWVEVKRATKSNEGAKRNRPKMESPKCRTGTSPCSIRFNRRNRKENERYPKKRDRLIEIFEFFSKFF